MQFVTVLTFAAEATFSLKLTRAPKEQHISYQTNSISVQFILCLQAWICRPTALQSCTDCTAHQGAVQSVTVCLLRVPNSEDSSNGIVHMGLKNERSRFDSGSGKRLLPSPKRGPTQPPVQWEMGALSLGENRPRREADHTPTHSA